MSFAPPTVERPLRGILLRDEGEALVVTASPAEVRRFAEGQRGRPVVVQQAEVRMRFGGLNADAYGDPAQDVLALEPGVLRSTDQFLYDREGRPVARVVRLTQDVDQIDVTSFGSTRQMFTPGLIRIGLEVAVLAGVRVE